MFVALNKKRETVNALVRQMEGTLLDFDDSDCTCPICSEPVKIRARDSNYMRPHFFHPGGSSHGGESEEHRELKAGIFFELLKTKDGARYTVECEKGIVLASGEKRYIDVAVLRDGRVVEAHEIQLSRNSKADFERRTHEYHNHPDGFTVNWVIREGGVNDKPEITLFLSETCGGFARARFGEQKQNWDSSLPVTPR